MEVWRHSNPWRFVFLWTVAVAAAFLLAACGGGSDSATTNAQSEGDSAENEDAGRSSGSSVESESGEAGETDVATTDPPAGPELSDYEPIIRPDGIELAFQNGALGPAVLGSTIEEITVALGPAYTVEPEESIRVDFPAGYSVSREGEVLFFAIEEDGIITVFMTQHSRVGLDSGLRPGFQLAEAISLHGEPTLTLGPENREFASFEDGTGGGGDVSVLVAIGQFGGPVGAYTTSSPGEVAEGYQLEEANIKELWFWAG